MYRPYFCAARDPGTITGLEHFTIHFNDFIEGMWQFISYHACLWKICPFCICCPAASRMKSWDTGQGLHFGRNNPTAELAMARTCLSQASTIHPQNYPAMDTARKEEDPKETWRRIVEKDLKSRGLPLVTAPRAPADRTRWRSFVMVSRARRHREDWPNVC